jgi:DNA repair exonuclease SbcCD ATPase subunit
MRVAVLLCAFGWAAAVSTEAQLNPITRVAELLEGLAKKVQMDGEAEQELYDGYKCWCMKVINGKSASIDANKQRIAELAAYIDDLTSGRVELTSERATLEAEIKELEKAVEEEEAMREKEHEDYLAAKDEMDKAVTALEAATATLSEATKDHQEAVLNAMASNLKKVMKVGEGFLAKKDLSELTKALDVPEVDWKKLNRDATFKKKYKARSGEIQDILADMLNTFVDNRNEAVAAEEKAQSDFDALMESKTEQLDSAKQALLDKAGETGARGEALATSEAEKSDLEGQNENDEGFLADTKSACETKAADWAERKRLRSEEIASINEAISVLRSDDARDTFKKSFDSQSFVQLAKKHDHRRKLGLAAIRKTAAVTKDARLAALSTMLAMKEEPEMNEEDPFKEVIEAIDEMLGDLKTEEETDLANKERCEKERMENTQSAKMKSKEIDTNTETIDRLTASIAAAEKKIKEIEEEVEDLNKQKQDASDQRTRENTEYLAAKSDDEKAVELVGTAVAALQKFYTDNGLSLAQVRRVRQEPFVTAGEAPTPPPTTWDSEYGGAKGENKGIVAILELIADDIKKDIAKATSEEEASVKAYDALVADVDASISSLESTKSDLEGTMADDESSMTTEKGERTTNQEDLDSTLAFLKEIAPGCDFIAVNFNTRLKNRQAEVDGLNKAKAILQGASFGF